MLVRLAREKWEIFIILIVRGRGKAREAPRREAKEVRDALTWKVFSAE